jgi:hypothetical protein
MGQTLYPVIGNQLLIANDYTVPIKTQDNPEFLSELQTQACLDFAPGHRRFLDETSAKHQASKKLFLNTRCYDSARSTYSARSI